MSLDAIDFGLIVDGSAVMVEKPMRLSTPPVPYPEGSGRLSVKPA